MTNMAGTTDYDADLDAAYEDEEPLERIREIAGRPPTHVSVRPASVLDVAEALLRRLGEMDTYRLQKLCYYAQAQHVAMYNTRLFVEPIEAWPHGPVIPQLWARHARKRVVSTIQAGRPDLVEREPAAADTIAYVADVYGGFTGEQLREMTHRERPWTDAREGLPPKAHSDRQIDVAALRDYYRAFSDIDAEDIRGA